MSLLERSKNPHHFHPRSHTTAVDRAIFATDNQRVWTFGEVEKAQIEAHVQLQSTDPLDKVKQQFHRQIFFKLAWVRLSNHPFLLVLELILLGFMTALLVMSPPVGFLILTLLSIALLSHLAFIFDGPYNKQFRELNEKVDSYHREQLHEIQQACAEENNHHFEEYFSKHDVKWLLIEEKASSTHLMNDKHFKQNLDQKILHTKLDPKKFQPLFFRFPEFEASANKPNACASVGGY
jgi:hypothetical protein